jgi:hypothetical protein
MSGCGPGSRRPIHRADSLKASFATAGTPHQIQLAEVPGCARSCRPRCVKTFSINGALGLAAMIFNWR